MSRGQGIFSGTGDRPDRPAGQRDRRKTSRWRPVSGSSTARTTKGGDQTAPAMTFEAYLRKMPDVGTDADFLRIEGTMRDIGLEE